MDEKSNQNVAETPAKTESKHALWFKILIPVAIVAIIVAIYLIKNAGQTPSPGLKAGAAASSNEADYQGAEFDLDATENFDMEKLRAYGLPVLIDFGADECIPCKEMAPVLKELNEELRGKAIVKFVDVWKNSDVSQTVPLRVIPTQFFFNADGTPYVPADGDAAAEQGFQMYSTKADGKHVFTSHEGGMTKEAILAVLKEMGVE